MTDFLAPSQLMAQQLQGVLQNAANTAADTRANLAERQFKQQQMAKEMEINLDLSAKLMPVNKELALEYFNAGLKPMGRSVTMENFDVASKVFEQAAEFKNKGDLIGMQTLLKQSDKFLVNLADQARAVSMQREAQQGLAGQQAQAITDLQPENPQLAKSRTLLNMANMVGGDLSRVQPDELVRLTGSTDPTEQQNILRLSQAVVEGHDQYRQHLTTLFSLDPTAFGHAAGTTALAQANPEILAKGKVSALLQKPFRTEEEERQLTALGTVYLPHLAEALNLKSATREKERLASQLEDTRSRMTALDEHVGVLDEATGKASTLRSDLATKGTFDTILTVPEEREFKAWKQQYAPNDSGADYDLRGAFKAGLTPDSTTGHWPDTYKKPNHPTFSDESKYAQYGTPGHWEGETFIPGTAKQAGVSDAQAKEYLLKEGLRSIEGQNFLNKAQPRIQTLEQTAQEAEKQREQLSRMAVSALPGQKDVITGQIKEFESMASANRAMARLLKAENPYALAQREAEIALLDDPKEKASAQQALEQLQGQRDDDLKAVNDEKARLARREQILQGRMPAAERKEEEERRMRMAHQAVDTAVQRGTSLTVAVREAGSQFSVDRGELAKNVMLARGSGIPEAQMDLLSQARRFRQQNGREPEPGEVNTMLSQTMKRYPGVKGEDVLAALKDPNRPGVAVSLYDPKQTIKEAGQLANVNQAVEELKQVRNTFINPDGSVNRAQMLAGTLGVPFTKGRGAAGFIEKAVEIKLRAATGQAARPDEMKMYGKMFGPSSLDSDELIKYKLDSFENWMQTVVDVTDPLGSLRERAGALLDQGTIQLLNTPEYKELRSKFPQASASEIARFLQSRKAKK